MRSRVFLFLTSLALALLAGCTPGPQTVKRSPANSDVLTADNILRPAPPTIPNETVTGLQISPKTDANRPPPKPEIEVGTGRFYQQPPPTRSTSGGEGEVTFNFENQPVQAVVKAILGDMLQENYTIAPNVAGNVTYSTSRPIRREDAMPVLEMLLSWTGNALVREGGRYTVLPAAQAIPGKLTPRAGPTQQPGYALRIFPLKFISASEMAKLLKPYAKPEAFVSIDPNRSMLVLAGTPSELDNYQRTITTFDIDWMRGMSIGVFTLQHVEVTKLMPDLEKIFGAAGESPLAGMFRFMPIDQTNSIVVITPQPAYLKQAEEWLYRLDRGGAENATQLYVYNVKNLNSDDLADYLNQIFLGTSSTGGSSRSKTSGSVGQGLRPVTIGGIGGAGGAAMNYRNSLRPQTTQEKNAPAAPAAAAPAAAGGNKESDIRISSIAANNQLMVMASPYEWDYIQGAIKKLDVEPLQVQIEARILEVTLSGDLAYGVQWWLGNLKTGPGVYDNPRGQWRYPNPYDRMGSTYGALPAVAPTAIWSYLNEFFKVQITALEKSGQARSLSAPSLVVNNNEEAQLSVGTQIPVVQTYYNGLGAINTNTPGTGTSTGTTTGTNYNSGLTGQVQYLNTGTTLIVKPRVNPGGLVNLDISQEVSNPGTTGGGTNPPINQRQLQTKVAVQSGQTLLLGGLIREDEGEDRGGVPLLNRVPVLRSLFGRTQKTRNRTELIILITPRVISNSDEARQMTEDYARQFESLAPLQKQGARTIQGYSPVERGPVKGEPLPQPAAARKPPSSPSVRVESLPQPQLAPRPEALPPPPSPPRHESLPQRDPKRPVPAADIPTTP